MLSLALASPIHLERHDRVFEATGINELSMSSPQQDGIMPPSLPQLPDLPQPVIMSAGMYTLLDADNAHAQQQSEGDDSLNTLPPTSKTTSADLATITTVSTKPAAPSSAYEKYQAEMKQSNAFLITAVGEQSVPVSRRWNIESYLAQRDGQSNTRPIPAQIAWRVHEIFFPYSR
ncbi:Hypothetical protein D9617_3g021100 [Elsinoe fawcettii]|nr:Hypothetical protein D9617_3g021100 [Elsinoe fawcettii]